MSVKISDLVSADCGDLEKKIMTKFSELAEDQEDLTPEFKEILYDNLLGMLGN